MNKAILCISLLGSACALSDELDEEAFEETSQEVTSANGISLNGTSLNGVTLTGINRIGASQSGIAITAVSVVTPPLFGAALVGSTWSAPAGPGNTVKLRIDAAAAGAAPNADLWFYKVSYQTAAGWSPLCGLDAGGQPIQAVSTAGVWASAPGDKTKYGPHLTQFTLACRGKTVAKCIELGYKTYKGYSNQLASCVRLLRGDYCGSGTAYTVDGTTLNLYDNVGVQADAASWPVEAEWTPNGARCVNKNNNARFQLAVATDPNCVKAIETTNCGSAGFANGAILIDELASDTVAKALRY